MASEKQKPSEENRPAAPERVLAQRIDALSGVKKTEVNLLAKLGLFTARDLLFNFPRAYEDLSDLRPISDLEEGLTQTVRGVVEDVDGRSSGFGRSRVGVLINDGTGMLRGSWFNQPYQRSRFSIGLNVMFSARPTFNGGRWEMSHPRVTILDGPDDQPKTEILPVYGLTKGIAQHKMRRIVSSVVEKFASIPPEVFSEQLLKTCDLPSVTDALKWIHNPPEMENKEAARRRFIFQELFVLQLALGIRRWQQRSHHLAPEMPTNAKINARIMRLFPFELTAGQSRVIEEIAVDMAKSTPMNRLLQGDVGSGKTVAAVYAMLLAVANGRQAVLMAPTEILAVQHARTLGDALQASHVRWAILTGGTNAADRADALDKLENGDIDILIGTHSVLHEEVKFSNLGLVVIDEQHKFGVRQRAVLRSSAGDPHYLVMTATPIPRTLAMAFFSDLDVSILKEMPPGRQEINTYLVEPDKLEKWWDFVREQLDSGRQAFIVSPLVDESENIDAASAEQTFESLTNGELEAYRIGLIHGRMSGKEKEEAMTNFRECKTQVLVCTSVIEVGVDVPNATVLTVLSPERFGLAQLHQLRGRVGRGQYGGFCGLVWSEETPEPEEEPPAKKTKKGAKKKKQEEPEEEELSLTNTRERMEAFVKTTDGFELAEIDFQMRGPGDLLGTQQHGMPPLRIANILRDREILLEARREALKLIELDPGLSNDQHARLRRMVLLRYGKALDISDVG